jgi:hypothetical protein
VAEGGLADKAGLKVGDVIVGISGIFGDLSSAVGVGIDEVYVCLYSMQCKCVFDGSTPCIYHHPSNPTTF